jgi:predicted metal-dependent HD superfamily phosphohydrolase
MTSPEAVIRQTWRSVAGSGHDAIADMIVARHCEPHRRYHTAAHVMHVINHVGALQRAGEATSDITAVRAAALFHDIIYDPRSSTNEADSARLAAQALGTLGWPAKRCALVAALVEATAGHAAANEDEAMLLDADLAILGGQPAAYQAYVTGVRAEYVHVDDDTWRVGRSAILRHFLDRPALFATPTMRTQREARARANLTAELASLVPR